VDFRWKTYTSTRQWDLELLATNFCPEEVVLVKKIPLSRHYMEATLIWLHVQSGLYSVKSGYQFLKTEGTLLQDSLGSPNPIRNLWKKIWNLPVPSKVKNFLWRACKNAIPMKVNLIRRRVIDDPLCECCKLCCWGCVALSLVLSKAVSRAGAGEDIQWNFLQSNVFNNFYSLVQHIMDLGKKFEAFAMLSWTIWLRRQRT